ncbi:ComEA family DNA-binding protein [Anaerovibrio lipolyticus]|uniref:ComEA family DNA-binding protein n=1 Tax=Anaerovibrio lipolyticus TaxID=82374 RepID=UPI0023F0ABDB|nr:ComEA family DNA-binding protein [Anaerovibrio lipolyticus]
MDIVKKSLLMLAGILLLAVGITYWQLGSDETLENEATSGQTLDNTTEERGGAANIAVYVCGAVKNPGVVLLSPNSRVGDAINSCGGLLPNANAENINLAEGIKDGMQIKVQSRNMNPGSEGMGQGTALPGKGESADGKININTAGIEELIRIPGVGKATAQRIIDYRAQNGTFEDIEDLKKIKGIGKAKFEKMAPKITI